MRRGCPFSDKTTPTIDGIGAVSSGTYASETWLEAWPMTWISIRKIRECGERTRLLITPEAYIRLSLKYIR